MIDIDNLNLSDKNKNILSNYRTYLITIKFLNIDTTINSYILDIYKFLEDVISETKKVDESQAGALSVEE